MYKLDLELSLVIILIIGWLAGAVVKLMNLPSLMGNALVGVGLRYIVSPALKTPIGTGDDAYYSLASELRTLALILILMRAGFGLTKHDVKKNPHVIFGIGCVPYLVEFVCQSFMIQWMFNWSYIRAAMLGSILAALGPALVIQIMLMFQQQGYGELPRRVLAACPLEVEWAFVLFGIFESLESAQGLDLPLYAMILLIPVTIVGGMLFGFIVGYLTLLIIRFKNGERGSRWLKRLFARNELEDFLLALAACGLLYALCKPQYIPVVSPNLSVMGCALSLNWFGKEMTAHMGDKLKSVWIFAEIFTFTLFGTNFDPSFLSTQGASQVISILGVGLCGRFVADCLCIIPLFKRYETKSKTWAVLWREALFYFIATLPRATVQAVLGPIILQKHVISGPEGVVIGTFVQNAAVLTAFVMGISGILLTYLFATSLAVQRNAIVRDRPFSWKLLQSPPPGEAEFPTAAPSPESPDSTNATSNAATSSAGETASLSHSVSSLSGSDKEVSPNTDSELGYSNATRTSKVA